MDARGEKGDERRSKMDGKLVKVLIVVAVLNIIHSLSVSAAAREGKQELKIARTSIGKEVPVGFREESNSTPYMRLLYDSLVGANNDGTLSKKNGAAYEWKMSSDARTWTFYIRKGIKFHDGTELTAKDVKFSIEMDIQPGSTSAYSSEIRELLESIEVPDPYKVIVHLKRPSLWLDLLLSDQKTTSGMILPKHYYEKVGYDNFVAKPIGSGPCKWVSQSIGSYMKLETIDNHWRNGAPKYKYLTLLVIPEQATRVAMLKTGEADVIDIGREVVAEIKNAGFNVHHQKDAFQVGLYPFGQWQNNPLADKRVRKALAISINRQLLVDTIFLGMAKPAVSFPVGSGAIGCGADPTLKPYPYDPEEAKRLLKEAGYNEKNPLVQPMAVYPRPGLPEGPQMMEAIAGYWEKLGVVKVKIAVTDWGAVRKRWFAQSNGGWVGWANIPQLRDTGGVLSKCYYQFYSKDQMTVCKRADADAILEKVTATTNIEEARKLLGDIHRLAYNEYLMWGVVEVDGLMATSKEITKWDQGTRSLDINVEDIIRQ